MKTITAEEATRQFNDYARLAHDGEKILVTRDGEPWVVLSPPSAVLRRAPNPNGLKWPDFAARLSPYYPEPSSGPTATELLARDKEDRF